MLMPIRNDRAGFTIVELLIVIVVIAILAAISVVAYTGIQARARDSIRKQDLAALAKATKLYAVDEGDYAQDGCGNGAGSGWLHHDYDGPGSDVSINTCLTSSTPPYLSKVLTDPGGASSCSSGQPATCFAYMKYSCTTGSNPGTYYYAHLETVPQTAADTDNTCATTWDESYGMNYYVKVD